MQNVLVVLSADHGVATSPTEAEKDKMPGGFLTGNPEEVVQTALSKKFGSGSWVIPGGGETSLYLDWAEIDKQKISPEAVYSAARQALLEERQLHVARVYDRQQLLDGVAGDVIAQAEMNGFFPRRSGDLMLVFDSGYLPGKSGTTHFSPYAYDRHVPLLFMGPGISPGRYNGTVMPNDVAPTLATMLEIETPSGSTGRVLQEMISR